MTRIQLNKKAGLIKPAFSMKDGDDRTRTCDPLHVKQMLSQLSYISVFSIIIESWEFGKQNLQETVISKVCPQNDCNTYG